MKKFMNFLGNQWGQRLTIIVLIMIVSDIHRHYTSPYVYGDSQVRTVVSVKVP